MSEKILKGQIIHKRKLSKKLIFLDIEPNDVYHETNHSTNSDDNVVIHENDKSDNQKERITIVLKSWDCGEDIFRKATQGNQKIHVGDEVSFTGKFEDLKTFSAKFFTVDKYWSAANPGINFIPKPPEDQTEQKPELKFEHTANKIEKNENQTNNLDKKLCKFYLNTGRCPKSSCKYSHSDDISKRVGFVKDKKEKQILNHESDGMDDVLGGSQRAAVYANWIVEKYGLENLKKGIVLDIGGGRGDLSFELATKRGLDCLVVDPRPGKLKRWQLKYRKKHPNAKIPKHIQDYFNEDFLKSNSISPSSVMLVVGLHPDEATEPLVSTALESGLDFCVIPCCVFSASFPDRRLVDGRTPTSYEDFCQYLKEKDGRIQEEKLSFLGKNKVLFLQQTTK